MLEQKREKFQSFSKKVGYFFSYFSLAPNSYTIISILFSLLALFCLIKNNLLFAAFFFLISILLDLIDGAVARYKGRVTKIGAYLDTICDRYVEGTVLIGFLFLPFPKVLLPSYVWILLALFGSLMTTYSKAAAKEKGLVKEELKRGFLERGERVTLIFLSMILGIFDLRFSLYPIIILAIFSNLTALQRIYFALHSKN